MGQDFQCHFYCCQTLKWSLPTLHDLPPDILIHIISFLVLNTGKESKSSVFGLDEHLAPLFRGLGRVSKSTHLACIRYIQTMPKCYTFIWDTQLETLAWACRNKMNLSSFTSGYGSFLSRSICTHALSCCNVQGLKVLDLRLNRGLKQSADEYKSKIILRLSQIISQLHVVYVKELMVIR